MNKNTRSWIVLSLLFGLVMLGFGIRHGVEVGKANSINEKVYKSKMAELAITPQLKVMAFKENIVSECGLKFLLPDNISTSDAQLSLICPNTVSEEVDKKGYTEVYVEGVGQVFLKSKKEYVELIRRTIEMSE